jgi:hypothetical protein
MTQHSQHNHRPKRIVRHTPHINMANKFFVLPAELRLKVYEHVVIDSMADGNIAGIGGLRLSCCNIYDEVSVDFVPKVRPLLEAMHKWQSAHPDGAPLQIEFLNNYKFIAPPTETTITLPVALCWQMDIHTQAGIMSFKAAVRALFPLCTQPWSTLTFRLDGSACGSKMNAMSPDMPTDIFWLYSRMLTPMDGWVDELENRPITKTGKLVMSAIEVRTKHSSLPSQIFEDDCRPWICFLQRILNLPRGIKYMVMGDVRIIGAGTQLTPTCFPQRLTQARVFFHHLV